MTKFPHNNVTRMRCHPAFCLSKLAACTSLVLGTLALPTAYAQQADDVLENEKLMVETIEVTARKRVESLQETPIAITALSARELELRGVGDLTDLGSYAPNVDIATSPSGAGGGGNSQITIRGIGQTDFLLTTDPAVGMYLDGVYFARSTGGVIDIVGLQRAEILRGPQGTLFGRNTIGGAISLTSQRPSDVQEGHIELTHGSFNRLDVRGGFDIPLIDNTLLSKFVFVSRNADGYATRLSDGSDLGDQNSMSTRLTMSYLPDANYEIFFAADYSRARENSTASTSIGEFNPAAGLVGLYNFGANVPAFNGTPLFTDPDSGNFFTTNATGPNVNNSDVYGASMTVDWNLSDTLDLKSITAYRGQDVDFGRDGDNSPLTIRETNNFGEQRQLSQELQLLGSNFDDRLNWVAGLFYFKEDAEDFNEVRLVSGLFNALEALPANLPCLNPNTAPPPCAENPFFLNGVAPGGPGNPANVGLDLEFDSFSEITNTSYAAFVHGTYDISEQLSATFGVRYTDDTKDFYSFQERINSGAVISDERIKDSYSDISPKLGLEYTVNPELLVYASYSKGFKAGGFNGRPLDSEELTSFDPETLDAYELGFKGDFFDQTLRTNLSVFFNKYDDIQLTAAVEAPDGSLVVSVDNAAKATVKGAELELTAILTSRLQVIAALSYLDTKYDDVGTATTITQDSVFVKAPESTANLIARYNAPLGSWGEWMLQADWSYKDDTFNDVQNSPEIAQDAYSIVNLTAAFEPDDGNWKLTIFGRNLGDETFIINGVSGGAFGISEAVVGRPREWGVSIKAMF